METFTSAIYFLITCLVFWTVKTGKFVKTNRYSRAEMISCQALAKTPENFLTVESIRSSFGTRPTMFRGKVNKNMNEKNKNEISTGSIMKQAEFSETVRKVENKENQKNKENKENVFNQNSSLSSFILMELENSVKELTTTNNTKKPVAPSGYSFGSLKSGTKTQTNNKFLNPNAKEYVIRKAY